MNYNILASGSKENCTIIENIIAIDMGVSFKSLKDYYKNLKIVFLTHFHGDHFNKTTIKKLAFEKPTLRFGCCEWLVNDLVECGVAKKNIDVLEIGKRYDYRNFIIEVEYLYHDVPNCAYKVLLNEKKLIYATDTYKIDHIEAKGYDYYLVEGNYESDEELQLKIEEKEMLGQYAYEKRVLETHLSKVKCDEWLLKNMGENSVCVYMHEHIEKVI